MELSIDDVRQRAVRRGLELSPDAVASAVAALNAGAHIAFVPDDTSLEIASSFATVLVATAAARGLCIGSLELYETAGALIPLRELLHKRFIADFWLILTAPTPAAISKVVDETRQVWRESDARLLVVTTAGDLRAAVLPPAAKRKLIPINL
jgi:hypothetical protein